MYRVAHRLQRALALGLLSLAVPLSTNPALAEAKPRSSDATLSLPDLEDLNPGQYRWLADASGEGPVRVLVSLPLQRAYVFRGEALIGVSTISSGRPGYDTPTGAFTILQKKVHHRSNLYDDAPMPHMQRLTWDGIALHAGAIPGEPASHGCIRLPAAFARRLYALTELGTEVVVTDLAPAVPEEALALASAS